MGFFPNYEKAGAGIDKDAPKRKGIFLYFELLWRYLWKLLQANVLYVALSLPIIFIYHYLFFIASGMFYGPDTDIGVINHSAVVFTVFIVIFWGTGPVSCGFTKILRNVSREEHVWISLDMFKTAKKSFKHGLIFLLVDIVVFIVGMLSISVYSEYAVNSNALYIIPKYIIIIALAFYTLMHFYIYELEVTFENKIREIYKNAALLSVATFPMCAILTAIICLLMYAVISAMPVGVILMVCSLFWIVLMRFIIDFYAARFIKRNLLPKTEESEK